MIDAVDETLTADEMLMGASFVTPAACLGWGGQDRFSHRVSASLRPTLSLLALDGE